MKTVCCATPRVYNQNGSLTDVPRTGTGSAEVVRASRPASMLSANVRWQLVLWASGTMLAALGIGLALHHVTGEWTFSGTMAGILATVLLATQRYVVEKSDEQGPLLPRSPEISSTESTCLDIDGLG